MEYTKTSMYDAGIDWRIRSVAVTGDRNVTLRPMVPFTEREKIDFVDVYSKEVCVTTEGPTGAPSQV